MTNIPADLSPETAAWLQAQLVISNARTAATLRAEINKVDDWASGLFMALRDVLAPLLCELPAAAQRLAPVWGEAAQRFDALHAGQAVDGEDWETLELLEARKMLYRIFEVAKLWPRTDVVQLQPARKRRA